jgi:hypothetical protein
MDPWVYVVMAAACVLLVVGAAFAVVSARRSSLRQQQVDRQLASALTAVEALAGRLDALTTEVADARRLAEQHAAQTASASTPAYVITGMVPDPPSRRPPAPDAAQIVRALEAGRPLWVPAKPLREALVRSVAVGAGVRRALSAESRDRILLEMRAEVRRSRRRRKAEQKALRRQLRAQRNRAA